MDVLEMVNGWRLATPQTTREQPNATQTIGSQMTFVAN